MNAKLFISPTDKPIYKIIVCKQKAKERYFIIKWRKNVSDNKFMLISNAIWQQIQFCML